MRLGLFAGRRDRMAPPGIRAALAADESVLAGARADGGEVLMATRFGLWVTDDPADPGERWGWELVSKATLAQRTLAVVLADRVQDWPGGIAVLRDRPARAFSFPGPTGLTDVVHTRVRGSVRSSTRLDRFDGGGWVVLRKVPGRDGLTPQFRLDPGVDPDAPGLATAVADQVAGLRARLGG